MARCARSSGRRGSSPTAPWPPTGESGRAPATRCVRVEHLRLVGSEGKGAAGCRRRRGSGSFREVHPGTWQLVRPAGPVRPDEARYGSVHGTRRDAEEALRLMVESTESPIRLGDLRVRELLDRYLEWLDDTETASALPLVERLIEPHLGRRHAVLLDAGTVHDLLRRLQWKGAISPRSWRCSPPPTDGPATNAGPPLIRRATWTFGTSCRSGRSLLPGGESNVNDAGER
jgi:hypothetical protein